MKKIIFLLCTLFCAGDLFAQPIHGKIFDAVTKEVIPAATISDTASRYQYLRKCRFSRGINKAEYVKKAVLFVSAEAVPQGNYTKVITTKQTLLTKLFLTELLSLLPQASFRRVHLSFVINTAMISQIDGNRVFIQMNEVPIAGDYKEALLKSIGVK